MFGFKNNKSEELKNEIEGLKKELKEVKAMKNKMEEEKDWLVSNNRNLRNEARNIRDEIEEITKQRNELAVKFEEEKNEINNQRNELTVKFEKEKNEIVKRISVCRKEMEEVVECLKNKKDESDRLDEIEKIIEIRENDACKLDKRRCELIKAIDTIEKQFNNKKKELEESIKKIEDECEEKRRELEEVKQLIENEYTLEESNLNTLPKYDFANSSLCKESLNEIREKQKSMVRFGSAVEKGSWTINGSSAQGKRFVDNIARMCLKTLNNGCDYIINSMKYSTYNSSLNKINKLFNDINRLNKINNVEITEEYLNLKIEELNLAFAYAELKEEEKEEQRRIREQMREEAKRQAELEEKRKVIKKEQQHYENELKRALERNRDAELIKKLRERIAELENSKKDVDKLEATVKAGYVYIISNEGSFGENCYKIGTTRRLNPLDRVDELGNASVPFKFDVHALIFSEDCFELESKLHKIFDAKRVNKVNKRKEFFNVTLDEIVEVVNNQLGLNVEFTLEAIAREYRESKAM